jgi:SWI/SNF-related matrix-associated actin-dependent regulator of chromatin subfamily A3
VGYHQVLIASRHLDGTLRTIKYHGQGREAHIPMIGDADIVVTVYNTLAVEFGKKSSPLHEIAWYRVVLDEGEGP